MGRGDGPFVVERKSSVAWDADAVWDVLATLRHVNIELMPLVFMRVPRGLDLRSLTAADVGKPLFVSWLFAFGLVPFDRHVLGIEALVERGFSECSHSLFHLVWRHRREILPDGKGSIIHDRVEFTPRFALLGPVTQWIVGQIFEHRHDKLKALFGQR